MKLLPSLLLPVKDRALSEHCKFCTCSVHTIQQFTVSLYSKAHTKDTRVSRCDLTPALLAE